VFIDGTPHTAMTYLMYPDEQLSLPSNSYYNLVADGYEDHGISIDQLNLAIDRVQNQYLTAEAV
jgi:hypothetical protein